MTFGARGTSRVGGSLCTFYELPPSSGTLLPVCASFDNEPPGAYPEAAVLSKKGCSCRLAFFAPASRGLRFQRRQSLCFLASSRCTASSRRASTIKWIPTPAACMPVLNAASRLGHTHGVEGRLASGTVALSGGGEVVFDMTTFQADTAQARQYVGLDAAVPSDAHKVTSNMLGLDVLAVSRYPRAVYSITSIRPLDGQAAGQPGRYQVDGRFTLHGVNQPVQLVATIELADKSGGLRMRGTFTIRQTAFGIQPYSALAGLARVADPLPIWGDLVLYPVR